MTQSGEDRQERLEHARKRREWLLDLKEGEEIRGYNRPKSGGSHQGTLVRLSTDTECPSGAPNTWGTEYIDSALEDAVGMLNYGLVATGLEIVEDEVDGERCYWAEPEEFDEQGEEIPLEQRSGPTFIKDDGDEARDKFNTGEQDLYIRFVVRRLPWL